MTLDPGTLTIFPSSASSGGFRVICQLYEGQCIASPGGTDFTPFEFFGTDTAPTAFDGLVRYDPLGIVNPSTYSTGGFGTFGSLTVPTNSSIIIPAAGIYLHSMSGHATVDGSAPFGDIDFLGYMGSDSAIADQVSGEVGWNWSQGAGADGDEIVTNPRMLTKVAMIYHAEGAIVYWAGYNNSASNDVNQFGFTWVIAQVPTS